MSNSVEYTKKNSDGETSTRTINHINENATDANVALMVAALNSLSKDTLTAINRVESEEVPVADATATISGGGNQGPGGRF